LTKYLFHRRAPSRCGQCDPACTAVGWERNMIDFTDRVAVVGKADVAFPDTPGRGD
jgi:hypothetical protein